MNRKTIYIPNGKLNLLICLSTWQKQVFPLWLVHIVLTSRKEQIDKYVNYYLAEETEDGLANINEVTNDLNRVFTKLAEPLNEIMNLE